MGKATHISWTGATWNPWQGCHKISCGCKNCFMFRDKERYGQDPNKVVRSKPPTFNAPLKWQREAERGDRAGSDLLVFTCSWSDWFIEEAGPWRDEAWDIVRACPLLTFQVLTKRADRIAGNLPSDWGAKGYPNVWMGVSVENQATADERIPHLLRVPAAVRFLSVEPLLASVDLTKHMWTNDELWAANIMGMGWSQSLDWVIVGGESGNTTGRYKARECRTTWIRSVVEQCRSAGVPCWVKQLGSHCLDPVKGPEFGLPEGRVAAGYSWKMSLRDKAGADIDEFPEDLRVRQMPAVDAALAPEPEPTLF